MTLPFAFGVEVEPTQVVKSERVGAKAAAWDAAVEYLDGRCDNERALAVQRILMRAMQDGAETDRRKREKAG